MHIDPQTYEWILRAVTELRKEADKYSIAGRFSISDRFYDRADEIELAAFRTLNGEPLPSDKNTLAPFFS